MGSLDVTQVYFARDLDVDRLATSRAMPMITRRIFEELSKMVKLSDARGAELRARRRSGV